MKVTGFILAIIVCAFTISAQEITGIRGQEATVYQQVTFGGGLKNVARLATTWYLKNSAGAWVSQGSTDLCSDEINLWGPVKVRHIWRLTLWEQIRARTVADGDVIAKIYTSPFVPNSPGNSWAYTRLGQNKSTDEIVPRDTINFGDPDTTALMTRWGNWQVIGGKAKICLSRAASASDTVFREFIIEGQ